MFFFVVISYKSKLFCPIIVKVGKFFLIFMYKYKTWKSKKTKQKTTKYYTTALQTKANRGYTKESIKKTKMKKNIAASCAILQTDWTLVHALDYRAKLPCMISKEVPKESKKKSECERVREQNQK